MKKLILLFFVLGSSLFINAQTVDTLEAIDDVFIYTWGGGQGANTFVKFDISSIPASRKIDSVFLQFSVIDMSGTMDGNAFFYNVNSQTWAESDSCQKLWDFTRSDTTLQDSGFVVPLATKATSINLKNIFLKDYDLANTYCTIMVKDSDDMTMGPGEIFAHDSDDTLRIGNHVFGFAAYFYSHETANPNNRPILIVTHSPISANSQTVSEPDFIKIYPNPATDKINIDCIDYKNLKIQVYNVIGKCVLQKELSNKINEVDINSLSKGMYIIKLTGENPTGIGWTIQKKMIKE